MIQQNEFDALKSRVDELEKIATEVVKTFQSLSATVTAHSQAIERLPALIDGMSQLAGAITAIQDELEFKAGLD